MEGTATAKLNKVDETVISALKTSNQGLTLNEIAEKTGESPKKIFKSLRKLFESEIIDTENRRYRILNK
jgi:predicted transcriptional regulator